MGEKPARGVKRGATDQQVASIRELIANQQSAEQITLRGSTYGQRAFRVCAHRRDRERVFHQDRRESRECVRCQPVVAVEQQNSTSGRLRDASVSRGGHPMVRLTDQADTGVIEAGGDGGGVIGGAIIDDGHDPVIMCLSDDGVDGIADPGGDIESGNYNINTHGLRPVPSGSGLSLTPSG